MTSVTEGSAAAATPSGYLQCSVRLSLGDFALQVACSLSAPWTVLFGPSGAGKTSLLRVLCGLIRPEDERIVLEGKTLSDTASAIWVPPAKRKIGFLSQRATLFPHMNVTENVSFGLDDMSAAERAERVLEMLSLFDAQSLARRMPADLSGGEKQRVALARSLAPQPHLLLLDEPFTGLDGGRKERIVHALTGWLAARSIPALYVSHDVAEAFQTGADVLVMDRGLITAQGPADVVLARQRAALLRQLKYDARTPSPGS